MVADRWNDEFSAEKVKEAFLKMLELVCDQIEDIGIDIHESKNSVIFEIVVHKNDYGHVIGRGGETAMALRVLMRKMAGKYRRRMILEISSKTD